MGGSKRGGAALDTAAISAARVFWRSCHSASVMEHFSWNAVGARPQETFQKTPNLGTTGRPLTSGVGTWNVTLSM
eukprot:574116-Pyramimonas_sp.AAC.2